MSGHHIDVLLCDDVPELRRLVRRALERSGGFRVVGEASNGEEAVELAQRLQPDVVLLDLNMPVMNGLQALPAIRDEAPGAKIIILSAFDARSIGTSVTEGGADGYVEKGTSVVDLVGTVRQLVSAD